MPETT